MYPGVAGSYHDNGGMGYWVSGIVKVASEELRVANLFTPNLMKINIDIHFTFYSLLITCYSLLVTRYSLLITCYSLLITHYSLLVTHYSLLITHYSLLITHYSLLI